jgi:hypothetical protein
MASILKAQESLGKNFTVGGSSRKEYQIGGANSEVQKVIYDAANKFIKVAQQTIRKKKKFDTGKMSDIILSEIYNKKGILGITIGYDKKNPASEYGKFQNKGVKGLRSSKNADSPYKFRDLNVSAKFIEAIMQWYLRHKNFIKTEDRTRGLKGLERKRKKITQIADSTNDLRFLAKRTAENIKRRGLNRVGFFDDNIPKVFNEEFRVKLAKALGKDIKLNIIETL